MTTNPAKPTRSVTPPVPAGDYTVARRAAELVFISGMTPKDGTTLLATGRLGEQISIEEGRSLAAVAASRALTAATAVAEQAGTTLHSVVSMTVYVAVAADFTRISEVADGASATLVKAFGRESLPTRTAVGVATLPGGAPVEIQLIATIASPAA
ncbi:RidA family protein [Streptomyces sp. ME19-01-6]|uniref:RidA family protein n=1 Tax=Streptomyces sp. ME19-01-6 TaxID=3028686 RepID=UPI0029AE0ABB|nr:RidA family protein [Streptomyces sp. ME19-01-6]MDX3233159.1 RidA family protein [Streptomyces sp. ME19-01-6]